VNLPGFPRDTFLTVKRLHRRQKGNPMRALTFALLTSIAMLTLAAAPASANPWHHHHHGFWGGPGFVFGLAGAAIAASIAADAYCVSYQPVYDDYGNYIGRRRVNGC
jgi:hypothetical protein